VTEFVASSLAVFEAATG